MIKRFNVTLDKELVKEVSEMQEKYGGKISPLINNLLKKWVESQQKLNKNTKGVIPSQKRKTPLKPKPINQHD